MLRIIKDGLDNKVPVKTLALGEYFFYKNHIYRVHDAIVAGICGGGDEFRTYAVGVDIYFETLLESNTMVTPVNIEVTPKNPDYVFIKIYYKDYTPYGVIEDEKIVEVPKDLSMLAKDDIARNWAMEQTNFSENVRWDWEYVE